jgi:transcription elongation factor GreA
MQKIREKFESELKELERELRVELPKEIERATALGDLRENAEYHAALERQTLVRARIAQLKTRLGQLATINMAKLPRGKAAFGSIVKVLDLDTDETLSYQLVLAEDGDPQTGKISLNSPIGSALVGREVGDDVTVRTPRGERSFEIIELVTIHEREAADDGGAGGGGGTRG